MPTATATPPRTPAQVLATVANALALLDAAALSPSLSGAPVRTETDLEWTMAQGEQLIELTDELEEALSGLQM